MPKANKPSSKPAKQLTLAEYEQRIGELTDTLQRLAAEFENYKKRSAAERAELLDAAKISVLTELLPALDNFDRAAMHLPKELEGNSWAQGMSYVGTQLEQILDAMGVRKFSLLGKAYDHNRAEALEYVDSDQPDGVVIEETAPGYEINHRVVRPAIVKVAKHSNHLSNNSTESKGE